MLWALLTEVRYSSPMMRTLLISCIAATILACPVYAQSPALDLAREAAALRPLLQTAQGAVRLQARSGDRLPSDLRRRLERFGLNALKLSEAIDATGGDTDLRCIFRGMANEVTDQLGALDHALAAEAQSRALGRMLAMLEDAERIAPAAEAVLASATGPGSKKACPAE